MSAHSTGLGVKVQEVTLRYGRTTALDRLSLTLPPGKIYGLIGRNGSGKTSLLSLLAAFRRPTSGQIEIDGEQPFENERITRQVCLIRDDGERDDERVDRILDLARTLRPRWDQEYADHLLDRFELPLRRTPGQLSRGQRAALGCVIGLASRAPLTIFDESYLGMDVPYRYALREEILADYARHPRTFILATHLVEEFGSLFERVVIIHDGRLLAHEEADTLRAAAARITGPAPQVELAVAGLPVLAEKSLGGVRQVTVYGGLTESDRKRVALAGLALEPVPLQELFVHLTSGAGSHTADYHAPRHGDRSEASDPAEYQEHSRRERT